MTQIRDKPILSYKIRCPRCDKLYSWWWKCGRHARQGCIGCRQERRCDKQPRCPDCGRYTDIEIGLILHAASFPALRAQYRQYWLDRHNHGMKRICKSELVKVNKRMDILDETPQTYLTLHRHLKGCNSHRKAMKRLTKAVIAETGVKI